MGGGRVPGCGCDEGEGEGEGWEEEEVGAEEHCWFVKKG